MKKSKEPELLPEREKDFRNRVKRWLNAHDIKIFPYIPTSQFKGFPDSFLCVKGLLVLIEYKTNKGRPSKDQLRFISYFNNQAHAIAFILRPSEFEKFKELFLELLRVDLLSYEFIEIREKLIEIGKG